MHVRPNRIFGYLLLSILLTGFDIYPEYQGLSETELDRFERPADQDAEYQSQINAYTLDTEWERRWPQTPRALDSTVGSITNQHFMIRNRAKFETDLLESLKFRFTYLAQKDREIDQERHVLELEKRLSPILSFAAYGEPGHYKRENDLGYALIAEPAKGWRNRFFVTFHDFTRGNHNDQPDRFVGDDPLSAGWTTTLSATGTDSLALTAGFRYDRPVIWDLPQQSRRFYYDKRLVFTNAEWALSEIRKFGIRSQWDSTLKGQERTTDTGLGSTVARETWRTDRVLLKAYQTSGRPEDLIAHELALMYASRQWVNQDDRRIFHQNIMPSALVKIRGQRREQGFDHVHVGVEATDFHTYGDVKLTSSEQKHDSLEARLHTAYEFRLRDEARLLLAFNFDLDEWGRVPTFEGGNARFRAEF
jgi:hypothetical protein